MQAILELCIQRFMHGAGPGDTALPGKSGGNHADGIMRLPPRARASMAGVAGAVIHDLEVLRVESSSQGGTKPVEASLHGSLSRFCRGAANCSIVPHLPAEPGGAHKGQ